jgi:RNA polymerase sigma factor (sigma-70 family)
VSGPEAQELLVLNLALIERAVAFACRRHRLDAEDADDFAAVVKLRLVDNDYAILRAYEERSSFATYISIVVQRMALDYRIAQWGKWHPSTAARRLGALAIDLEQLVFRDSRTLDEAMVILSPKHGGVTRQSLQSILDRLPVRAPRHRDVEIAEAETLPDSGSNEVEEPLLSKERQSASERLSAVMGSLIAGLPDDDRLILQLRFEGSMTVAQIARSLGLDQKMTYRRIERRMGELKVQLLRSGFTTPDVLDLIGRDDTFLRFDLGKEKQRPSIASDERTSAHSEGFQ